MSATTWTNNNNNNNEYKDMKIAAATILSALAFSSMVSAAPAKRDNLNCHAASAAGALAARAHVGSTDKQYFAFTGAEGHKGQVLTKSDKPGPAVQFYACEKKPAENYYPGNDDDGQFGQLRLKEDPSQCVTVGSDKVLRLKKCEEGATEGMEGQWFTATKAGKGCASTVWHAALQGQKWEGQVELDGNVVQLDEVSRSNMKSAVGLKLDNGSFDGKCKA